MPIKTDLNVAPYFDDFVDIENKNYHRILFRPTVAVQARELTQVQTILQNQIERFGNWAFRDGDIVEGCVIDDLPVIPYVYLSDYDASNNTFNATKYVDTVAVSSTSNLQARVIYANVGYQTNYPNSNILYVKYLNTGNNGATVFAPNELIQFYNSNGSLIANNANVYTMSNSVSQNTTGSAHGISVSNGTIFINGNFVKVTNTLFGLVNAYGTNAGNNIVGFQSVETIVTENIDSSLNDNALGYPNYNAPGAHRLKITPTLISIDPNLLTNTSNFNAIATYNYNALVSKSTDQGLYSEINKAIATRTYEESGNYVVNPFSVDVVSSTVDPNTTSNNQYMFAKVGTGVGYAMGSRVSVDRAIYLTERRGTDTETFNNQKITFNYGNFIVLSEFAGYIDCTSGATVNLYDTKQSAVTSRTYTSTTLKGNIIGTARARCLNYSHNGFPGANNAYYSFNVFDIKMTNGKKTDDIKSVVYDNGGTKGIADVVSNPVISGSYYNTSKYLIGASLKDFLFTFGSEGIKNLRDSANNINTQYQYRTISSATLLSNGNITVTITSSAPGGTDILPYGAGVLTAAQAREILITPTSTALSSSLGTVNVTSSASTSQYGSKVIGTGLLSKFYPGDVLAIANSTAGTEYRTVNTVVDDATLYVDAPFNATNTAATYYKAYPAGKNIFYSTGAGGAFGLVNVTNSTSFTITLENPPSSSTPVKVTHDISRTSTSPAAKVIKKNRFVKIAASDLSQPGPWSLGYSDVHKVTAVYANTTASYAITNQNVTNMFTFDTGQKDTHYDIAHLHLKPGFTLPGKYLLVQLDYFTPNTTPGVGFFTVESYPIDDANTANTNAIQTKDIPLYVSEAGMTYKLRDAVDFRPVADLTATDTGIVDLANNTSVATAIGLASINPSNTITFTAPAGGFNVPSYSKNLQSDYNQYLPRYDLVYISPDNTLKIKEGQAGLNPNPPLYPDNAMAVAQIYVPPYPSLTSEQTDSLTKINQACFSLCRDASTRTQVNILSNRKYTMRDIGQLDKRITNLEYYVQLTLLQQEATNLSSTDANGVERYKNGIFVDPFNDFSLCDVSNPEFNIAIDVQKGRARPKFIRETIPLQWTALSTFQTDYANWTGAEVFLKTGGAQETIISQPYCDNSFSPIPVTTTSWVGYLRLFPAYSSAYDLNNTGSLNMTVNYSNPYQSFSSSPFGFTWGDWRTNINSTVNTGAVQPYNPNLNYGATVTAGQISSSLLSGQLYSTFTQNDETPSFNYIHGRVSARFLGDLRNSTPSPDAIPLTNVSYGGNSTNPVAVLAWAYGWK